MPDIHNLRPEHLDHFLQNIKNNPIEQEIHFNPVKGQKLIFKATRIVDNAKRVGIAEFSVITED